MDDRAGSVARESSDEDTNRRAREIRSEIERTREDLSETVDAIQEKLRPSNIVAGAASATTEKVKDMAYSAADSAEQWWEASGGNGFIDRIRRNPVPAILAGVGLTWLAFSNGGHNQRRSAYSGQGATDGRPDHWREGQSARRGMGPGLGDQAQRKMADAQIALRQSGRRLETMVREYPLAVGAAAVLLGASLGMAVPETEQENEWMGEARENAVQRAQEAATGAVERVKEAAADVVTRAAIGD